jgi:acetylornithine/succinyldiaminopimelate/putrescine aminotransferase
MIDADGRKYFDTTSEIAVANIGSFGSKHGHAGGDYCSSMEKGKSLPAHP